MWQYNYRCSNDKLMHYGIMGMKWGVRRYQNQNGTLTAAGRSRYGVSNEKKKTGLSTGQKVAIGVGAAALVATGAYFVHKYRTMNCDAVIKSGKTIQHMARTAVEDPNRLAYVSYLKGDNKVYARKNFCGIGWKYKKTFKSTKDIKIAGKKTAINTFAEWIKKSPIAQEKFDPNIINDKKILQSCYYKFNINFTSPDINDKRIIKDFFSTLSDKGYDAIRDVNDQVQGLTKSPIVLFNGLSSLMQESIVDITNH